MLSVLPASAFSPCHPLGGPLPFSIWMAPRQGRPHQTAAFPAGRRVNGPIGRLQKIVEEK